MILLLTVTIIFAILVICVLYVRYCRWGRLISKIPGNRSLPVLADGPDIIRLTPETAWHALRHEYTRHGRISKVQVGKIAAVNIYHPDDVETLFSTTRYNEKQTPYNFLKLWLGEGLLISNGEKWKQRRKLLTPAFHFNILKSFCGSFNEQTKKLLERLDKETDKEATELQPITTKATLNVMCETSMGISMNDYSESASKKYIDALHSLGLILEDRYFKVWYHLDWIYRYGLLARKEKKIVADLHAFTTKIVQDRKVSLELSNNVLEKAESDDIFLGKKRLAMLDLLLQNEKENKIDLNGVREEVDTFMFEGHDTTAMALTFMIMRIANETDIQEKIFDELQQIFGVSDRPVTTEDLKDMKYLELCIKESLRLYPSVPFVARYVTEDVVLGGYTVPADTIIQIHIYDIHHSPTLYPEPERFVPERFLPGPAAARHPYAYIPFSAGPRNCIGQKFAMMEMKTVMSGLIRKFRLEPVTRYQDIVFIADMILRTRDPIYVRFRPRTKTA